MASFWSKIMRQTTFPRFFILSAHRDNLDVNSNHQRTREVYNTLLDLGLDFACVTGVYKGSKEASFMIFDNESQEVRANVELLCKLYNQECYLERDKDNEGYLVYPNATKESLGVPKELTREETKGFEGFTILPQKDGTKKYFTFVKEQ
jgi:hypothetical protein